jgi:four helix bundle protein
LQEADETQLWLELLRDDCGIDSPSLHALHHDADELIAIFVTMIKRTKER